jgi:hypothetical protein
MPISLPQNQTTGDRHYSGLLKDQTVAASHHGVTVIYAASLYTTSVDSAVLPSRGNTRLLHHEYLLADPVATCRLSVAQVADRQTGSPIAPGCAMSFHRKRMLWF